MEPVPDGMIRVSSSLARGSAALYQLAAGSFATASNPLINMKCFVDGSEVLRTCRSHPSRFPIKTSAVSVDTAENGEPPLPSVFDANAGSDGICTAPFSYRQNTALSSPQTAKIMRYLTPPR